MGIQGAELSVRLERRSFACVSALEGIDDPLAYVNAVRELLRVARDIDASGKFSDELSDQLTVALSQF